VGTAQLWIKAYLGDRNDQFFCEGDYIMIRHVLAGNGNYKYFKKLNKNAY